MLDVSSLTRIGLVAASPLLHAARFALRLGLTYPR